MRTIILFTLVTIIVVASILPKNTIHEGNLNFVARIAKGNIAAQESNEKLGRGIESSRGSQKCDGPKRACKKVNQAIK